MREPFYATRFKKDFKLCQKRGYDMRKVLAVMGDIADEMPLSPQLREHPLAGGYSGYLECHVEPDWLLVYRIDDDADPKEVYFARTGTHSDLFD
ncbi:MAG: type II toxin-antitoxin system YafQ family toxin [Propionibacteriaceae bacterium]|nr:type II toxin-antitoxin system YafQ family toxin [Propionibacteriaceae bacterium]